jgi:hypothetical protein
MQADTGLTQLHTQSAEAYSSETVGRKSKHARLTPTEHAKIARLKAEGLTIHGIAVALSRDDKSIKRVFDQIEDTRELAKLRLAAGAAEMAARVVRDGNPAVCVDVLERVDVLKPRASAGQSQGVQVMVGIAALPGLPGWSEGAKALSDAPEVVHVSCKSLETKEQFG